MTDNMRQIQRASDVTPMPMYGGGEEYAFSEPPRESLVDIIMDRFGGRWKWMALIGIPACLLFALIGWVSGNQTYMSTGAIRIEPKAEVILTQTPEGNIPYYEKYVRTQMMLIQGRRNLDNALNGDPELSETTWAQTEEALYRLEQNLEVEADTSSQMIWVRFEWPDPALAQKVVDAVMDSYYNIYGRSGGDQVNQKLERLKDYETQLRRELRSIHLDSQQIVNRYASADLSELHNAKLETIEGYETLIKNGQRELRRIESGEQAGEQSVTMQIGPQMLQRLKEFDPKLAELHTRRATAENDFETIAGKYRPGTPVYDRAKQNADIADRLFHQQLDRALAAYQQSGMEGAIPWVNFRGMSPPRIREEIAVLEADVEKLKNEAQQISADIKTLNDKKMLTERAQSELDRTLERITALDLESSNISGLISIAQEATRPLGVYADSRKKHAVFGFGLGLFGTVGVFFVLGTVDRRAYATNQLKAAAGSVAPPCLGVLPVLNQDESNDETREVASHCVHQIRNQIEALRDPSDGYVLTVSSPFQGDGKTSIVLALGWSYAAAGYRTVLVDCDFVGRSLTRQLGMVGDHGLKESMLSGELNGAIKTLSVGGLDALPCGADPKIGPESVRRRELQRIFDELKTQYELIIVDTGPLLGSLESTPVSAASDGVLLTVRRGRSRTRLEECVNKLDAVGAHCVGMVLNYAGRTDTYRYVSEASLVEAEAAASARRNGDSTLSRAAAGERNALVLAMESTSRSGSQPTDTPEHT